MISIFETNVPTILLEFINGHQAITRRKRGIERTGCGKVNVVHHKEIAKVIASDLGRPLNEKQMRQISAWLEDRCRNVEF